MFIILKLFEIILINAQTLHSWIFLQLQRYFTKIQSYLAKLQAILIQNQICKHASCLRDVKLLLKEKN